MSISVRDRKLLWANSGNRCATCDTELIDKYNNIIGEEAHIISSKPNGPRGNTLIAQSEIDSYENLILLCPNHHTEIEININKKYEEISIITLDSFVEENNIRVGLIKVDIEGSEQDFLKGAEKTIKTQKPFLLISIYHNA